MNKRDLYYFNQTELNESRKNLTPEEKMDRWHKGERRENIKACSDDKLKEYRKICKAKGYAEQVKLINIELKRRKAANECSVKESVEIGRAAANIKSVIRKYAKDRNMVNEMMEAVDMIKNDLKSRYNKINEEFDYHNGPTGQDLYDGCGTDSIDEYMKSIVGKPVTLEEIKENLKAVAEDYYSGDLVVLDEDRNILTVGYDFGSNNAEEMWVMYNDVPLRGKGTPDCIVIASYDDGNWECEQLW